MKKREAKALQCVYEAIAFLNVGSLDKVFYFDILKSLEEARTKLLAKVTE